MKTEPEEFWEDRLLARFEHLTNLEPGWSGYPGSGPVRQGNVDLAMAILGRLEGLLDLNKTQVVPGEDGGLQLEWHDSRGTIEIYVDGTDEAWTGLNRHGVE